MAASNPPRLSEILVRTAAALESEGGRYALIGAMAVGARGYVRATADADFVLHIERIRIPSLLDRLREEGFSVPEDTLRAMSEREIVKLAYQDIEVDLLPAVLPYFHEVIRRATPEEVGTGVVRVATVDDLVVLKLLAGRAQDWSDILGLLAGFADEIDIAYVLDRASGLLPEHDARLERFQRELGRFRTA